MVDTIGLLLLLIWYVWLMHIQLISWNASVYTSVFLDVSVLSSGESDCLEEITVSHDEAGKVHIWPVLLDAMAMHQL